MKHAIDVDSNITQSDADQSESSSNDPDRPTSRFPDTDQPAIANSSRSRATHCYVTHSHSRQNVQLTAGETIPEDAVHKCRAETISTVDQGIKPRKQNCMSDQSMFA